MEVPVWEWMVRRGTNPYMASTDLGLGPNREGEPDWAFERFGMSRTRMPDGRIICIGGEHEDYYDPDFCIYNDVIVLRAALGESAVTEQSGTVEIYGYPASVFPPTDFHSATLIGNRICVIGCLGYQDTREIGRTPVLVLDARTLRVEPVPTHGEGPGWVSRHHAAYDAATDSITVRGGKVERGGNDGYALSYAAHRLRLKDLTWEVISPRERHREFVLKQKAWDAAARTPAESMFRTDAVPFEALFPADRGIEVFGISVLGVRITFEAWVDEIRGLIEGDLPENVIRRVLEDVTSNLTEGTGTVWELEPPS